MARSSLLIPVDPDFTGNQQIRTNPCECSSHVETIIEIECPAPAGRCCYEVTVSSP